MPVNFINVVGRPPVTDGVAAVGFDHVLCDLAAEPIEWLVDEFACNGGARGPRGALPFAMEHLGAIRLDPGASAENLRLDSGSVAAREVAALGALAKELGGAAATALVCDLTNVDEGRAVDGLARVAARLDASIAVAFGASVSRAAVAAATEKELADALKRELVVGVDVAPDVSRAFPRGAAPRPRAAFLGPVRPAFEAASRDRRESLANVALTAADRKYLGAAAAAAKFTGAPLIVCLPPDPGGASVVDDAHGRDSHTRRRGRAVLEFVDGCVDGCDVILRGGSRSCLVDLAEEWPRCNALVDGFGLPLECRRGATALLDENDRAFALPEFALASTGVRHRSQLKCYGGFGYAHAATFAGLPPISLGANAARALSWATAPKKAAAPTITLVCTLCAASFEVKPGEHYQKFDFVYCGRKCLKAHGTRSYDASLATGPTAKAQRL